MLEADVELGVELGLEAEPKSFKPSLHKGEPLEYFFKALKELGVNSSGVYVNTGNLGIPPAPNNGQINFNAGNGLTSSGANATANQGGNTTKTFTVQNADNSISVGGGGIKVSINSLPTR